MSVHNGCIIGAPAATSIICISWARSLGLSSWAVAHYMHYVSLSRFMHGYVARFMHKVASLASCIRLQATCYAARFLHGYVAGFMHDSLLSHLCCGAGLAARQVMLHGICVVRQVWHARQVHAWQSVVSSVLWGRLCCKVHARFMHVVSSVL
jgi:hypothetical protein